MLIQQGFIALKDDGTIHHESTVVEVDVVAFINGLVEDMKKPVPEPQILVWPRDWPLPPLEIEQET
jgi:hypothetical protein